jgi:hypothetical protein
MGVEDWRFLLIDPDSSLSHMDAIVLRKCQVIPIHSFERSSLYEPGR